MQILCKLSDDLTFLVRMRIVRAPTLSIPNGLGALRVYANSIDPEYTPRSAGTDPEHTQRSIADGARIPRHGMVLTYADSICKLLDADGVNTGTPTLSMTESEC